MSRKCSLMFPSVELSGPDHLVPKPTISTICDGTICRLLNLLVFTPTQIPAILKIVAKLLFWYRKLTPT